ncbi:MAG: RibD family protein [Geminicoccaceae bacterium]
MNFQTTDPELRDAWQALLALRQGGISRDWHNPIQDRSDPIQDLPDQCTADEKTTSKLADLFQDTDKAVRQLIELYEPLCRSGDRRFVVAHLGQSLDGRIAAASGSSRWVTGQDDVVHNHRMRALFDVVLVGAGTVYHDDPQLTVREVEGHSPLRVVIDPRRRLARNFKLFNDDQAETLMLCGASELASGDLASGEFVSGERHGQAEVVGLPMQDGQLAPETVLEALERRGLKRIFVEGGGVTVSRFLDRGCLNRLQITVAPIIIGSGRPSISLPEIDDIGASLRPRIRNFPLGDDVLFECCFDHDHRAE